MMNENYRKLMDGYSELFDNNMKLVFENNNLKVEVEKLKNQLKDNIGVLEEAEKMFTELSDIIHGFLEELEEWAEEYTL